MRKGKKSKMDGRATGRTEELKKSRVMERKEDEDCLVGWLLSG